MSDEFEYEWDDNKARKNLDKHGIAFESAKLIDWDSAICLTQNHDGEERQLCHVKIGERLHAICYTIREDAIRVISLRKSNKREVRKYEKIIEEQG